MQRHGGELAIRSEAGQGSTFTCHLPVTRIVRQPVALPDESGYAPGQRA
jgi:chemotaxis protein histidine kinase CheA